jgi:alkaline phosphatase D
MLTTRRSLLIAASLAPAAAPRTAWAQALASGVFTHGVASGDPLPDGVILWTRFVGGDGRVAWEVAEDERFTRIAQRGQARAAFANDFCVKADVRGLAPGRPYFYRFLSASGPSLTGRTRTAPAAGGESLTVALFSCANFPSGYFHAYSDAAAREDIDLALHVGDYIYEYPRGTYPSETDTVPGRILDPMSEIVRLSDYYQRYATYHSDAHLLALRQAKPIAAVWDDHELANDTWSGGAQNHQPDTEGLYTDRIAAASKAYFDWMPIRRPEARGARIYRSLDWGDLARILLLDTRYIGRDRQLDYRTELLPRLAQGGAEAAAAAAEFRRTLLDDPNRTLLGAAQERWFAETLVDSKQRNQPWQIVAQQIVMGDQFMAQGMSRLLPASASEGTRQWLAGCEHLAALNIPWNLDSWGGYPAARARFLNACTAHANNAVVLAGDTHNCWLNNLPSGNRMAAVEFGGGSVSSPGLERTISAAGDGEREAAMRAGNIALAWCDIGRRGYASLRFTRTACEAEWRAFDDVRSPQPQTPHITRMHSETSISAGPGAWSISS